MSKCTFRGLLIKRPIVCWIVLSVCLLGGIVFAWQHSGLLTFLLLVIAGTIMAGAVIAFRSWTQSKAQVPIVWTDNRSKITHGWEYRPKAVNRRTQVFDYEPPEVEIVAGPSSSLQEEGPDVWFNFTNPEPPPHHVPPLSGDACNI